MSKIKSRLPLIVYLLVVIIILCFFSLLIGATKISASKVFVATFLPGGSDTSSIIWQVRMPRLALAILSGTLLAMAGSIFLGIFGTIIMDNIIVRSYYLLASLVSAISVFLIAFGFNLNSIYFWLLGSLEGASWGRVLWGILYILFGFVVYVFYYKDLNAMLFGEYTAKTLGVEVKRTRALLFVVGLILSAVAVSTCGLLCLTALILPYYIRLATGVNYKYLIPVSVLASASLVILIDIFSRIVFPAELPLGVIMVVLSAPFYIYALQRRRLGL